MGIRFVCHGCGRRLNIKSTLAGKRGVCPGCSLRFRIPFTYAAKSIPIAPGEPLERIEETVAEVDTEPAADLSQSMPEMKQFVTTIRDVKVQVGEHLIGALQQNGTVGVLTTVVMGRDGQQRVISASLGPEHSGLVDELVRIAKVREATEHDQKRKKQTVASHETDQPQDTKPDAPPIEIGQSTQDSEGRKNFAPWRT